MDLHTLIRYQLVMYCFVNEIHLSPNQLTTLTYLAEWGEMNISDFCNEIYDRSIYGSPQTVRNFILECVKDKLIVRSGKGSKLISITSKVDLLTEGGIVLKHTVYTDGQT